MQISSWYSISRIEDNGDVTECLNEYDLQNICEAIYDKTRPPMFTEIEAVEYQEKKIIAILYKFRVMKNICSNRW